MKIAFKNSTRAGNNYRTELFFDEVRVAEIHCTPKEFTEFFKLLENGWDATYQGPIEVTKDATTSA